MRAAGAVVAAAARTTAESLAATLAALDRRLGLLEDVAQLERLNSIYGYYLAHLQWDDLTGIFSPTGSIEIAMRGVYVGAASVRRNLNLYGQATDDQFGLQHNHMQFQPVITVAPDGQSAKLRSRALSIMGNWERYEPVDGRRLRERLRQRGRRLEDQARPGVQHVFRAVYGGLEGRDSRARRPALRRRIRRTRRRRCRSRCTRARSCRRSIIRTP